jgi:hypothetical protein
MAKYRTACSIAVLCFGATFSTVGNAQGVVPLNTLAFGGNCMFSQEDAPMTANSNKALSLGATLLNSIVPGLVSGAVGLLQAGLAAAGSDKVTTLQAPVNIAEQSKIWPCLQLVSGTFYTSKPEGLESKLTAILRESGIEEKYHKRALETMSSSGMYLASAPELLLELRLVPNKDGTAVLARLQGLIYTKAPDVETGWFVSKKSSRDLILGIASGSTFAKTKTVKPSTPSLEYVALENVTPPIAWVFEPKNGSYGSVDKSGEPSKITFLNPTGGFETGWIKLYEDKGQNASISLVPFVSQTRAGSKFAAVFATALGAKKDEISTAISGALKVNDPDDALKDDIARKDVLIANLGKASLATTEALTKQLECQSKSKVYQASLTDEQKKTDFFKALAEYQLSYLKAKLTYEVAGSPVLVDLSILSEPSATQCAK